MSNALIDPMASVRAYLAAEKSPATRRAYNADWAAFQAWGEKVNEQTLPASPLSVAKYIATLADGGLKAPTIIRKMAAIRYLHRSAGHEPPTNAEGVKQVMRGIRRQLGNTPNRKAPATAAAIAGMLAQLPDNLAGLRDRAMLLIGLAAALRRSELVALNVADVEIVADGAHINIGHSKTDQEGRGEIISVPRGRVLKPIDALEAWLAAAKIQAGPIFREVDQHGHVGSKALATRSVARIVKRAARAAGLDEKIFSGHSLRAGFVTSALEDGVDILKVMKITRHADARTLRIYDRRANGFRDHAGKGFL